MVLPVGLSSNPDLSGIDDEESFIVTVPYLTIDHDELQGFQTTCALGGNIDRAA